MQTPRRRYQEPGVGDPEGHGRAVSPGPRGRFRSGYIDHLHMVPGPRKG